MRFQNVDFIQFFYFGIDDKLLNLEIFPVSFKHFSKLNLPIYCHDCHQKITDERL